MSFNCCRNRLRTKEERKNKLVKLKEESQRANGMFKLKDLQRWNDIKLAKMKKANIPQRGDAVANDIWAVGGMSIYFNCLIV